MKDMHSKWAPGALLAILFWSMLSGCSGGGTAATGPQDGSSSGGHTPALSGTIKMMTNRIDLIENGTFDRYAQEFKQRYPDANVDFEGLPNYASDILVRLSTRDAGDVLLIPINLSGRELEQFFEPLDESVTAGERFSEFATYQGRRYGLTTGTATVGIIYNKKAFQTAGITKVPATLDEFYAACAKLKAAGITPVYLNYGAVWPLREWGNSLVIDMSGNPDYVNDMVHTDEPWRMDNEWGRSLTIARTLVARGYVEEKLFTNSWEVSKTKLASGEAGMYLMGSWAIPQIIGAGASAEDIGFFPFPYDNSPVHNAPLNPDWQAGVSKYSSNKELAKAWLDFFVNESSYQAEWGLLPDGPETGMPQYSEFLSYKPKLLEATVQSDAFIELANKAELSFGSGEYLQELIAAKDLNKAFGELNARWKEARAELRSGAE